MSTFADWAVQMESMLRGHTTTAWMGKGEALQPGDATRLTEQERWAKQDVLCAQDEACYVQRVPRRTCRACRREYVCPCV